MSTRVAADEDSSARLIRVICFIGFASLPLLILFVHLLLIYRD